MKTSTKVSNSKNSNYIKRLPVLYVAFLLISILQIPLGFIFNMSHVSLFTFLLFIIYAYIKKQIIVFTYVWYFILAVLSVIGVFACETTQVSLYEISRFGHYSNSITTIVTFYMLFFIPIITSNDRSTKEIKGFTQPYSKTIATVGLIVGILLELYIVSIIYDKPYFSLGYNRTEYSSAILSTTANQIKGWLPFFIPCAIIVYQRISKIAPLCYFLILMFIYFWVGDKFGTYFFAIAVIINCVISTYDESNFNIPREVLIRRFVFAIILFAFFLFAIGLFQRIVLYGNTLDQYYEFLSARLAQQGQIWWAIFDDTVANGVSISELPESFLAAFSQTTARAAPYAGQWKMMLMASNFAEIAVVRVAAGMPYTTTTQATLFYYFSWISLLFAPVLGYMCKTIIDAIQAAMRGDDCLVTMLLIKISIAFNALYTASELSAFFLPTNIAVFILLFILTRKSKYQPRSISSETFGVQK